MSVAGNPAIGNLESYKLSVDSIFFLFHQCFTAEEWAFFPFQNPFQIRFQNRCGVIYVISVKHHSCFQSQCVARPQTCKSDMRSADFQNAVPQMERRVRSTENFKAVLACIAGASGNYGHSLHIHLAKPVILDRIQFKRRHLLQKRNRLRPLNCDLGITVARIDDFNISGCMAADVFEIHVRIGGVYAKKEVIGSHAINKQVIHKSPFRIEQATVMCLIDRQFCNVVAGDLLHESECISAFHFNLPHMRDIEDAGGVSHSEMLTHQSGIFDRHFPAGKRDHLCAGGDVGRIQWCASQILI